MTDQNHPQYIRDRGLLNRLLQEVEQKSASDYVLAELARLRIRYMGFPGAHDIQQDLDQVLNAWGWSEADLFTRTRQIHRRKDLYQESFSQRDDWS